jgi:hypothetical protein
MNIRERDALREKRAKVHARLSNRASALVADRERSGRLMVQTSTKVFYHAASQIAATGLCRHDLPLDVCAACRRLESSRTDSRYVTVAKRKLGGSAQEVSAIKDRGYRGIPKDAPSKETRLRQVAVRQPSRPPIGEEVPESKPALFPVRGTDGGVRQTKGDNVEADMKAALRNLANSKIVHATPRVTAGKNGPYCVWSAPIVREMPVHVPFKGQSWTPLEVAELRKQRQIA